MELKGKKAIVTGVSKGIGLATVEALLNDGAIVFGWGRSNNNITDENYHFIKTDVSDADSVGNAYEETLKLTSTVDVLINNAGLGIFKKMEKLTAKEWKQMFSTNVDGIFYCSKPVIPMMKEQGGGHIVNIASTAGMYAYEGASAYCGTKHAVRGISKVMVKELSKHGIKVSCICPDAVQTNFFDEYKYVTANETMMHPNDVAKVIIQALELPDNFLTKEIEVHPLKPDYFN